MWKESVIEWPLAVHALNFRRIRNLRPSSFLRVSAVQLFHFFMFPIVNARVVDNISY